MNRSVLTLSLLALALVAGCDNEARDPFAIADWVVRCDSEMGMCSPGPVRTVEGENVAGNTVSCQITESESSRLVNVTVGGLAGSDRYQVQISAALVPRGGGAVGGDSCSVLITDGSNRFRGRCGANPPSVEQPCQVMVEFDYDETVMTPTANVRLLCDHLPNEAAPTILRAIGAPTSDAQPAELLFYFCGGLTQD